MSDHLRSTRLWAAVAAAALVACQAAVALPSRDPAAGGVAPRAAAQALPALVPPANDAFAAADAVAGLPFAASLGTLEATTAADDPSCAGNAASVWYAYTPPVTAWLTASTAGSDYDTTLSAYTGTQGALVQIACNDDWNGSQSEITFLAQAGVTYHLMAAGKSGGGALELTLDIRSPLTPIGVRTTPAYEGTPAAGPDHVAWSQWPRRGGRFWAALVQPEGAPRFAVNRARTHGYFGGFDGDTLVFQEARGNQSSIFLYDLATRTRSSPPAGINTRFWEWHPTISGDWVVFGRRNFRGRVDFVFLRNLVTGESRRLDRTPWLRRQMSEAGQVSGNHAVWYRCTDRCRVFRHDIAAVTTAAVPNPGAVHAYNPSVTGDGTVYFVRSGRSCGAAVRIARVSPAGSVTVVASLPRGWDSFHTYALENDDGTTSVFYDRTNCRTGVSDIFKVIDP